MTMRTILLASTICFATLMGCTSIRYDEVHYMSILQRKSLEVEVDGDRQVIRYNTQGDAAVEALAAIARGVN